MSPTRTPIRATPKLQQPAPLPVSLLVSPTVNRLPINGLPTPADASVVTAAQPPSVLRSLALLGKHSSVEIEHLGQIYRLQATRQGKLILTK